MIRKLNINIAKRPNILICLLVALVALTSGSAYADSQQYAIACQPNAVTATSDSSGNLTCNGSAPNETAVIDAVGSDASSKSSDDTIVKVDCGKASVKTYKAGDQPSELECQGGSTPTVTTVSTPATTSTTPATTSSDSDTDPAIACTADQCDLVKLYVDPLITVLSAIAGVVFVISLILASITYITAGADPQKVSVAKKRILNTIIAMFAFLFLYAFLQFLIPGGLFNKPPIPTTTGGS